MRAVDFEPDNRAGTRSPASRYINETIPNALMEWEKISEETLHSNDWWTYKRDRFRLPSGKEGAYHYVHTPGSVMIVPEEDDGYFLLVRQYRYLNGRHSLEFPGGGIAGCEDPISAARKELAEEAQKQAGRVELLGVFNPFNGVTDELCSVFHATGLVHTDASPDETEEFEIIRLTAGEVRARIAAGEIWDGMTMAAWAIYENRRSAEAKTR
jgi:8-oxo-dGTP pyrophosphatase MutT (NUDIX family)